VHVRAVAAGTFVERVATLDQPRLNIVAGHVAQVGMQESIQFCAESSSLTGTVGIHLDHAVFNAGATSTPDATEVLAPGDCGLEDISPPALSWTVYSHALFTAIPAADPTMPAPAVVSAFQVTATLQNATSPMPPIATQSIAVTPIQPVVLSISSTIAGAAFAAGTIVPLQVTATYGTGTSSRPAANISISFQTIPVTVTIVPSTLVTSSDGQASASLLMPSLASDGGTATLLVEPLGGNVNNGITLTN